MTLAEPESESPQARVAARLRWQSDWCRRIGSPLYEALLAGAADDVERGGPVWSVLAGHEDDPPQAMIALRLMGGVHRLVLEQRAPALAPFYPSAGGSPDADRAWPAFLETVEQQREPLRALLENPVQTNEVGRAAALLGGFLETAAATGLPLRLLEVGASAGLNLRWDKYFYSGPAGAFGDPRSPVQMLDVFAGAQPPLDTPVTVRERRGCDAHPLDPTSESDRITLLSYLWPDQRERLDLIRGAFSIAAAVPAQVERADAADWVERNLSEPAVGTATVLFHSIVLMYLSDSTRERILAVLEAAGRRATPESPLAWLRMEPGPDQADVWLTSWPGGRERLIARSSYHGRPVEWLDDQQP